MVGLVGLRNLSELVGSSYGRCDGRGLLALKKTSYGISQRYSSSLEAFLIFEI